MTYIIIAGKTRIERDFCNELDAIIYAETHMDQSELVYVRLNKLSYLEKMIQIKPTMTIREFNRIWKRYSASIAEMQGEMK
jgi:hypothetical protein